MVLTVGLALAHLAFLVPLTDDRQRTHAELMRKATKHRGFTMLRCAQEAEKDPTQFNRIVDGTEKQLSVIRQQDDEWWRWYGLVILERFGLPRIVRIGARARRVVTQRKRMARMALNEARKAKVG